MKRLLLVVVVLVAASGCLPVQLVRWQAKQKVGTVSAVLCGVCSEPYSAQMQQAHEKARAQCHGSYSVIEEGVTSDGSTSYAAPVGTGFVVGTAANHSYYWVFKCDDVTLTVAP